MRRPDEHGLTAGWTGGDGDDGRCDGAEAADRAGREADSRSHGQAVWEEHTRYRRMVLWGKREGSDLGRRGAQPGPTGDGVQSARRRRADMQQKEQETAAGWIAWPELW